MVATLTSTDLNKDRCPACGVLLSGIREASRLHRYLNGLDIDDADKRAEHVMQTMLDGLSIGPTNRNSVKAFLADHFADLMKQRESA